MVHVPGNHPSHDENGRGLGERNSAEQSRVKHGGRVLRVVHGRLLGAVELLLEGVLGGVLVAGKEGGQLDVAGLARLDGAHGGVEGESWDEAQGGGHVLVIFGEDETRHFWKRWTDGIDKESERWVGRLEDKTGGAPYL